MLRRESSVREARIDGRNRVTLTLIIIALSFIFLIMPAQLMEFFTYTIEESGGQAARVQTLQDGDQHHGGHSFLLQLLALL